MATKTHQRGIVDSNILLFWLEVTNKQLTPVVLKVVIPVEEAPILVEEAPRLGVVLQSLPRLVSPPPIGEAPVYLQDTNYREWFANGAL